MLLLFSARVNLKWIACRLRQFYLNIGFHFCSNYSIAFRYIIATLKQKCSVIQSTLMCLCCKSCKANLMYSNISKKRIWCTRDFLIYTIIILECVKQSSIVYSLQYKSRCHEATVAWSQIFTYVLTSNHI